METEPLSDVLGRILDGLASKNGARERALAACRVTVRSSANAIRTAHRNDFANARALLDSARDARDDARNILMEHPDVYHAGFVHDAQKEYAEAEILWHLGTGAPLPTPENIGVEHAAYLNGLAEAVGELRRMLLDRLRKDEYEGCEEILAAMDTIYGALVCVDFPEAITGGLRHATDQTRGILERTRGDLTMAAIQRRPRSPGDS